MAQDIASAFIVGNLTADPIVKQVPGKDGTKYDVAEYSVAVNHRGDRVSYFDLQSWGPQAKLDQQYLVKGKQVAVICEPQQSRWEDENGKKNRVRFRVENIKYLGAPNGARTTGPDTAPPAPAPTETATVTGGGEGLPWEMQ